MSAADLAILTNARGPDQRSMIGYGDLLLENARQAGLDVREWRASSQLGRLAPGRSNGRPVAKLLANLDRFVAAPLALAGRRTDLIHVVDPGNILYLDLIRHRAAIVTVHDVIPFLCLAGRLDGFRPTATGRWLMRRILKRLARVDRIVCVSDCTRRDLLSIAPINPDRIQVIPNAVFQPMRRASDGECHELRARLGLAPEGPIILHVGSNSFYKNRRAVVDVFARVAVDVPDALLLFVGPRTSDVAARIDAASLARRVHFAPTIPREAMATVYSMAAVLLFPSIHEGFGYPVLEAQLCGTPVVCSNAGALPEVAGTAALMAGPEDKAAMTESVLRVIVEPAVASQVRAMGYLNAARFAIAGWQNAHRQIYGALKRQLPAESARVPLYSNTRGST